MQSFKKKIVSLIEHGTDGLEAGMRNFKHYDKEVEQLAELRKNECLGCPFFINEPISFLRVVDKRIPELSNNMCDECGCTLSYKLRQSINKCSKWQK